MHYAARVLLTVGVLGLFYGAGYARGQIDSRATRWFDRELK